MNQANILEELGLNNLPVEEKAEIALSIGRIIYQNVVMRVLEEMDNDARTDFERFLETNSENQDAIYEYLKSKITNLDGIVAEEIQKFRESGKKIMDKVTAGI